MALVNISLCNDIYDEHHDILDEIFDEVKSSYDYRTDEKLSCVIYKHYQSIFDEIFLSLDDKRFGKTPKSTMKRSFVSFTDLYKAGLVKDGMEFEMVYDGVSYNAIIEYDSKDRECYLLLLDENKQPYHNSKGEKIGYYTASSQAGMDAINLYRKNHQMENRITSLNGTIYWKTKDGRTVKDLIEKL